MESLANKYRPQTFSEVVGQERPVAILQNQIKADSTKQAYAFVGGAGTGKTTVARIFARELNKGEGEIIEIDAASNNSVDNVREMREKCKYKPITGRYKVYIIDEVHMLSTGAFNALLKTLEEPPAHAVFILCTTDPQKIPATILSRVQRFDFSRIKTEQIVERLKKIVQYENYEAEEHTGGDPVYEPSDEALDYIARLANGGMRDAITILDTCLGYSNDLQVQDVEKVVGGASTEDYLDLTYNIATKDYAKLIKQIEDLHERGKDLRTFMKGFTEFIVELRKIQITDSFVFSSLPRSYDDDVNDVLDEIEAKKIDLDQWFKAMSALLNSIRYERHPKTLIIGELITL